MQGNTQATSITRTVRTLLAVLIVISTALFVLGVAVERSGSSQHQEIVIGNGVTPVPGVPALASPQQSGETGNSGESSETHPAEQAQATSVPHNEASENGAAGTVSAENSSETVLGISLEDPWVVTAFVIGWLALLIALFLLGRPALILILIAALASTLFDIAEVLHQVGLSNSLVIIIAVLVAVAHVAVAVLASMALMGRIPPVLTGSPAG